MKPYYRVLVNQNISLRVSNIGGSIVDCYYKDLPILKPYKGSEETYDISKAASFPLVPFANRIEGNAFSFQNKIYKLAPNILWDPHFLHGEGWISHWTILTSSNNHMEMEFRCNNSPYSPYNYLAYQMVTLDQDKISIRLSVKNCDVQPMPFGLGHHPFFHLTKDTLLKAKAEYYYTEKNGYLPDKVQDIPKELNFGNHRHLPHHWVNNGFAKWDGIAQILWNNHKIGADITASKNFNHYFIFISDTKFDPDYKEDFFCFEPMTHSANAHNKKPDELVILKKDQILTTQFNMAFFDLLDRK